ncbi:MAG: cysteine-rich CWC family protein [Oxalobacteraceae bacterium]
MSHCLHCGKPFHCAMADGEKDQPCWCFTLPAIPASALAAAGGDGSACFCPECLQRIAQQAGVVSP